MIGAALLLFPKLALGLSGFETGVAVMPLVRGEPATTPSARAGRIRNTRKLLLTAALIMSVFLIGSSVVTTLLIPPEAFAEGRRGQRPRARLPRPPLPRRRLRHRLRHQHDRHPLVRGGLGHGRAAEPRARATCRPTAWRPDWARATRPLVLVFTAIAFVVTILFDADVDAQGGAYATGVLFLMTSASVAVTIAHWRHAPALALPGA